MDGLLLFLISKHPYKRLKEPVIFCDRLKWSLYIGCVVKNQPEEVLKIISDMVYSI